MLLLAHCARPGMVEVVTVDHGLRAESAAEAQFVAKVCSTLDIPHSIVMVEVAPGNLQEQARLARYAAMAKWLEHSGLPRLATAHHADDQAETLMMRLNRSSGVSGLAGVRTCGIIPGDEHIPLIRPLLGWRRAELAEIVTRAGIDAIDDPSNLDTAFDRVRMRENLANADWLDITAIGRSAAHMSDADEALDWMARREWDDRVEVSDDAIRYRPEAPRAVRLRIVAHAIAILGKPPRGRTVSALLDALEAGEGGNIAGVSAMVDNDRWRFTPEPSRSSAR